jgi:hypothetical protein
MFDAMKVSASLSEPCNASAAAAAIVRCGLLRDQLYLEIKDEIANSNTLLIK